MQFRQEGLPMDPARAVFRETIAMQLRAVALVLIELVSRIFLVVLHHLPIPLDLGQDRSHADLRDLRVAVDDGLHFHAQHRPQLEIVFAVEHDRNVLLTDILHELLKSQSLSIHHGFQ